MLLTARYDGLQPSSLRASVAARGSSKKADTKPELLLRAALWRTGLRYRKNKHDLLGAPDIVFATARVVVFVDGDFWHGKSWKKRRIRLSQGHNAKYWIQKIEGNIRRDQERNRTLKSRGWTVIRIWESDIQKNLQSAVNRVTRTLATRAARFRNR